MEQSNQVGSFAVTPGKEATVKNVSPAAVTYRAEFIGAGSVTFTVLPGGEFVLQSLGAAINLNIEAIADSGIAAVTDAG